MMEQEQMTTFYLKKELICDVEIVVGGPQAPCSNGEGRGRQNAFKINQIWLEGDFNTTFD